MNRIYIGRHVYGLAAVAFDIITLVWHDFNNWQQIRALGNVPHREIFVYVAGTVQIFGGVAIQWPRTTRTGAFALGAIYLMFALLWVPRIVAELRVFDHWGNVFEQLSLVSGALIVYGTLSPGDSARPGRAARIGYILFGICVVSFTTEQLVYLSGTAAFVPKWIPPGQMFWAIATTIAFALAAIALLSGRSALLASRLLTAMLVGFGLLDECSLSNYTLSLGDVLMGYALSEAAAAPGLQRGRAAHVGTPPQIANRAEEAYGTRGDLAGLGRRSE